MQLWARAKRKRWFLFCVAARWPMMHLQFKITKISLTHGRSLRLITRPYVFIKFHSTDFWLICMQFIKKMIHVPYKSQDREYPMYYRPLWEWALGLLDHPRLISQFTWDACKITKFDGLKWVRLIHEPWTANDWWDLQVRSQHAPTYKTYWFVGLEFLTSWCKAILLCDLCGQDSPVLLWNRKGLSYCRLVRKSPGTYPE